MVKLNLLLDNPKDCLSGYANVDPFAPEKDDPQGRLSCDVNNLDPVCDDGEASELVVTDILSYFPARDVDGMFAHWLKKLAHGGIIRITDIDLYDVGKALANRSLSVENANLLLYGEQAKDWQFRRCLLSVQTVVEVLKTRGMQILKKRTDSLRFVVEARRP